MTGMFTRLHTAAVSSHSKPFFTPSVSMLVSRISPAPSRTLETGYTWFYSRSRQMLWNKGETSGHVQKVISVYADCDEDTLLLVVEQTGPACHTGAHSCFFREIPLVSKNS